MVSGYSSHILCICGAPPEVRSCLLCALRAVVWGGLRQHVNGTAQGSFNCGLPPDPSCKRFRASWWKICSAGDRPVNTFDMVLNICPNMCLLCAVLCCHKHNAYCC